MNPDTATEPGESAREIQVGMQEEMRRAVLLEMRRPEELAALSGRHPKEMRRELESWTAEGRIFSVVSDGAEYFPPFALDPNAAYRRYPVVAAVIAIFGQVGLSRWALSSWFVGLNGFLDDQRPIDLLATDPDWVIEAATDSARHLNRDAFGASAEHEMHYQEWPRRGHRARVPPL